MGKSPTRKKELFAQLENPNAGPVAHMKSCPRCASDIERIACMYASPLLSPVTTTLATA
jgi:hypothetical protein